MDRFFLSGTETTHSRQSEFFFNHRLSIHATHNTCTFAYISLQLVLLLPVLLRMYVKPLETH